jgi:hypothetical protein
MNEEAQNEKRDEVLFAFHRACERPSAADIIEWVTRHPEFADDIRAHAAIRRECGDESIEEQADDEDAVLFARGRSHALSALHEAKARTADEAPTNASTFDQLMAERSVDIPKLAKELDIARGVLAALFGGRMDRPVGKKLVTALMTALRISLHQFDQALEKALGSPKLGHAKGSQSATIYRQAYEEVIRESTMSDERKAYWLGEE